MNNHHMIMHGIYPNQKNSGYITDAST